MRHDVDAVVVGVGSGGTLTGLGRFFNRVKPRRGIEMVLADPTGSILYEYVKTGQLVESGSWAVEGIGEDFIPEIADMSLVTEAFEIDDEESFADGARAFAQGRNLRRLVHRHASRRRAALLPAANKTETRRHYSFRTPATSISPKCITIFGWPSRDSFIGSRTAT